MPLACSGVTPLLFLNSQNRSTISSIRSNFFGSTISAPRILNPLSSAAFSISSGSPTRIGCKKLLASRREDASRIRGSLPSVNTIFFGLFFNTSISCPKPNIINLLYLYLILLLATTNCILVIHEIQCIYVF